MKHEKLIKAIIYKGHTVRFYRVGDAVEVEMGSLRLRMIGGKDMPEQWATLDAASRAAFKAINQGLVEQWGMG